MARKNDDRNRFQINRQDNRDSFVETKSDWFSLDQVHLEFATYDKQRPEGDRFTNHVHIYLNGPKFASLASDIMAGILLNELRYPTQELSLPLFEDMGGTSAEKYASFGKPRQDGMGQSRIMKILRANKKDSFLLVADNGPGETNRTGLVVPKFGKNPENHVVVTLSHDQLKQLIVPAYIQYSGYVQANVFQRAMNGEFQNALNYRNNNTTNYPAVVNFNQ